VFWLSFEQYSVNSALSVLLLSHHYIIIFFAVNSRSVEGAAVNWQLLIYTIHYRMLFSSTALSAVITLGSSTFLL